MPQQNDEPLLEWKEEHRIGIQSLDYEHQDLFERLSELHTDVLEHVDRGEIEDCLGRIHARVSAHFALEEKVMREAKFPNYRQHKAQHDAYLDAITEVITDYLNDPSDENADILERQLRDWIINHVLTSDKELVAVKTPH